MELSKYMQINTAFDKPLFKINSQILGETVVDKSKQQRFVADF